MKIFALLTIDNQYDQPPNNLLSWWPQKPSFKQIQDATDLHDVGAGTLFREGHWHETGGTDYRIGELYPGKLQD